jgi:hypothetical protein
MFKLLMWMKKLAPVNVRPWNFICWQIFKSWTTFKKTIFMRNKKTWKCRLVKAKMFYGDNSWTVALRQMKCGIAKSMEKPTSLFQSLFSMAKLLNVAMVRNF